MQLKAELLSHSSTFFYSISLSMVTLLIPLYALHLGYSPLLIGLLVSAPGVIQLCLRLFGGAFSDRFGERRVLWFSFVSASIGLLIFVFFESLLLWFLAQLVMGVSRSVFWSSSQSYASKINEAQVSSILGRLSSLTNAGQVLGIILAGVCAGFFGYQQSFIICVGCTAIAFILSLMMPDLPQNVSSSKKLKTVLGSVIEMVKIRVLYFAGISAFVAALNFSLIGSFYPMYFRELGFAEPTIGILNAIRPIGSILVGFFVSLLLSRLGHKWFFAISLGGTGIMMFVTPFFHSTWSLVFLMFIIGITTGSAYIQYQIIVSEHSSPQQRGISLSFAGLFWAAGMAIMPSFFGVLISFFGMDFAFFALGGALFLISLFTRVLYKFLVETKKNKYVSIH